MSRNPVVHFEIGCTSAPETREFFTGLFDWNIGGPEAGFMIDTGQEGTIPGHIVELAPPEGHIIGIWKPLSE